MNNYKPTIGIEVHLELKTAAKAFSRSLNDSDSNVNTNINEIDLGYPGVLPVLNKGVIDQALKACLGLNMHISKKMHFDRKNYFYPDLPKGYQITQFDTPIGKDGYLLLENNKKIRISDLHIEEDTAKSMHYKGKTLLNYNRAGVPLIEIVSYPDINSKEEAMEYASKLRELMLYLEVSDCKIEEGRMRFDVNISVSNTNELGVRSEIKNIGSISNIGEAIDYEIKRQTALLEQGETLFEETRKFDDLTKTTIFMRRKDSDTDYRYFPEPDIPYIYLKDEDILKIENSLDMLPFKRREIYMEKGISKINIEKLLAHKELSDFINKFLSKDINFIIASNLLVGDIASYLNKNKISILDTKLTTHKFLEVVNALEKKEISSKIFKDILPDILEKDLDIKDILNENKQIDNEEDLTLIIEKVVFASPESVKDYKQGKDRAFKYLMGMIMKETKGKANPSLASKLLKNILANK